MSIAKFPAALALLLAATMWSSVPAGAAEQAGRSWIDGYVQNFFEGDFLPSRHSTRRSAGVYLETKTTLTGHLLPGLDLVWHVISEPVTGVAEGETRIFGDMGIFTRRLYLSYEHSLGGIGPASLVARVFAGKFTLAFGRAWDIAPGIYGDFFSSDTYEYDQRVGFGGALDVRGGVFGDQTLQASVFFLDTSALSNSLVTPRGRNRLSDGGVSNTERLNSFALSWTGK